VRISRALVWAVVCALLATLAVVGVGGYLVFGRARQDALTRVDAIVVLGGEHDGREQYGIGLARAGYARTVVLSNPYGPDDRLMNRLCASGDTAVTVLCEVPNPGTTRGEALFTQRLATARGWHTVIVISWRYHLPRAHYIFGRCFHGRVVMRAVPREYDFNAAHWELTYIYQTVGTLKAAVQGGCAD
jgi:uncharacterized SAM-binding protein YcdF (DUF218 family)